MSFMARFKQGAIFRSTFFISFLFIFVAAFTRLIPHPPNFTPLIAISLFSGAYFSNRILSALTPVLAMFLSDLVLGFHDLMIPIYAIVALISLMGRSLNSNRTFLRIGGFTLTGSLFFFLSSNFLVWLTSGMYEQSLAGFLQCYILALPFYQNQLAGDLLYSASLFGLMHYLERSSWVVRAETKS